MPPADEVVIALHRHLQAIMDNDLPTYHATTSPDLTLYEWWITPHRIDGIPFHDYMMENQRRRNTSFGAESSDPGGDRPRFDLANLHIQRYGDTVIASYTLLISSATGDGVKVAAHNESRVIIRIDGEWKVVHVHKSPAWSAPHLEP